MMKGTSAVLFANLMLVSLGAFGDTSQKGCLHEGQFIEPFGSVWVIDPVLRQEHVNAYEAKGLTEKQIDSRLKNADWTGFRLVCQPIIEYKAVKAAKVPAEAFSIAGYSLNFNQYSMGYYRSIQKQLAAEKDLEEKSE